MGTVISLVGRKLYLGHFASDQVAKYRLYSAFGTKGGRQKFAAVANRLGRNIEGHHPHSVETTMCLVLPKGGCQPLMANALPVNNAQHFDIGH